MVPSPKLPTNNAPPNAPQVAGAIATPQGEFSGPLETTRFRKLPLKSKVSTNPLPGPAVSRVFAPFCFAYITYSLPPIFQMLKGANPAGRLGSVKLPARVT